MRLLRFEKQFERSAVIMKENEVWTHNYIAARRGEAVILDRRHRFPRKNAAQYINYVQSLCCGSGLFCHKVVLCFFVSNEFF